MTQTIRAVPTTCPKCQGPLWDNRGPTKKNPKAPDFKCRDKSCDGVYWPPSQKDRFVWADQAQAAAPQPPQYGGPQPYDAPQETGAPPAPQAAPTQRFAAPPAKQADYWTIFGSTLAHLQAMARNGELTINGEAIPMDLAGIGALVATQYIQACKS